MWPTAPNRSSGWRRLFGVIRERRVLLPADREVVAPARSEIVQAAVLAARYLHTYIRGDGSFVYRIDASSGREDRRRYNVLRHAGSVLALAQHARQAGLAGGDAERLKLSARFLVDQCVRPPKAQPELLAVWSDPELTGGRRRQAVAKLGGNGLALAALLELEALRSETANPVLEPVLPIEEGVRALGEFILFMQRPDGSFRSLFGENPRPQEQGWVSLYYPGEAALGLIMLFEHDGDARWLSAAVRALLYLARSRAGRSSPPDHWALIATERLFGCSPEWSREGVSVEQSWQDEVRFRDSQDLLIGHAEAVTTTMLDEQCQLGKGRCPAGWFGPEPRIAPTATRLEGLLAASRLPLGVALQQRIGRAIDLGLRFLLDSQLQQGPAVGGFTRTCLSCAGASDKRATEVRIDYVQHALAAFRDYLAH